MKSTSFYSTYKPLPSNTKDFDLSLVEDSKFPEAVYVGEFKTIAGETVPALLPLKEVNGLCFLSHPENVQQIHNCMQTIALRILLSLPPGLCKFTLYDGTNLGANLIALSSLSPKIKGENQRSQAYYNFTKACYSSLLSKQHRDFRRRSVFDR